MTKTKINKRKFTKNEKNFFNEENYHNFIINKNKEILRKNKSEYDKIQAAHENVNNNKKIYNTDIKLKKENWPKFAKFMENQFNHGGDKYSMHDDSSKEVTDWVCELSPGETGADWVLQTICKYAGRYKNFQREKDLFKIATYAFIMWLKMGYHLEKEHDEDIKKIG